MWPHSNEYKGGVELLWQSNLLCYRKAPQVCIPKIARSKSKACYTTLVWYTSKICSLLFSIPPKLTSYFRVTRCFFLTIQANFTGKRERPSRDWFSLYHLIGREGGTITFINHKAYWRKKLMSTRITFDKQLKLLSFNSCMSQTSLRTIWSKS